MKVPYNNQVSWRLPAQSRYRPRRYEQRDTATRKSMLGQTVIMVVDDDWKTFKRYHPKWDKRLYHYMYRYFDQKGSA